MISGWTFHQQSLQFHHLLCPIRNYSNPTHHLSLLGSSCIRKRWNTKIVKVWWKITIAGMRWATKLRGKYVCQGKFINIVLKVKLWTLDKNQLTLKSLNGILPLEDNFFKNYIFSFLFVACPLSRRESFNSVQIVLLVDDKVSFLHYLFTS